MKKICLVVVGLYLNLLNVFSQISSSIDSSQYKTRKLTLDEINFVNSYYHQNGNNSAVTGGIGTQFLNDYANDIEVTLTGYTKHHKKKDLDIDFGIDYYTSASSDKIDPSTISSASSHDLHIFPTVTRTITNEQNGNKSILDASFSTESDYLSAGFGGGFAKQSKDKSRELEAKANIYLDQVRIILPVELRTLETGGLPGAYNFHDYPWKHRNTFTTSFTLSQIINERLQVLFLLDAAYQQGFLSLPFHRIYFNNGSEGTELLPSTRSKLPIGVRANYFLDDKIVIRSFYRFYIDDWGLNAHTADIETAIKFTPFFSIAPFYRYYTQNSINWFAPYKEHSVTDKYYSSDYDLSAFRSYFFGAGFRITPPDGVFGKKHWSMLELRYGHYYKNIDFHSDIISINLQFKE
jgi:hypothetical protein